MAPKFRQGLEGSAWHLVAASAGHDGKSIADRDQTSPERDRLAGQPGRVAVTIPALVMVVDSAHHDLGGLQTAQE
ncbi:hypothetical protein KTAU_04220 [Thermogemmatispora aurantia]|uniref:Uncharacterized protein n=1 Tax=Thermogemmatispora aurantia TaxID=2045279 RepID=A0A5J4JWC9_9CHLR|nr:hypothetical protein KTAU_04220 [Thermogemmatispora aurantia]